MIALMPFVQMMVYFGLLHLFFDLSWKRSLALAALRVVLGIAISVPTFIVTQQYAATAVLSAAVGWTVVALLDPSRSWGRAGTLIAVGLVVSIGINFLMITGGDLNEFFKKQIFRGIIAGG